MKIWRRWRITCAYVNCNNIRTNSALSFFKFPHDKKLQKIWIENCGNDSLYYMDQDKLQRILLCESHFPEKYIRRLQNRRSLQRHGVPFHFREQQIEQRPFELIHSVHHCYSKSSDGEGSKSEVIDSKDPLLIEATCTDDFEESTLLEIETCPLRKMAVIKDNHIVDAEPECISYFEC